MSRVCYMTCSEGNKKRWNVRVRYLIMIEDGNWDARGIQAKIIISSPRAFVPGHRLLCPSPHWKATSWYSGSAAAAVGLDHFLFVAVPNSSDWLVLQVHRLGKASVTSHPGYWVEQWRQASSSSHVVACFPLQEQLESRERRKEYWKEWMIQEQNRKLRLRES